MSLQNGVRDKGYFKQRAEEIEFSFRHGQTMPEIAKTWGIHCSRVQQILRDRGITRIDGGTHVKALVKLRYSKPSSKDRFTITYGCMLSEASRINGWRPLTDTDGPCRKYYSQKRNAKNRGISWELTLPQWMMIWFDSGRWNDRGRGQGYCMARVGDTGPYAVGNVEIKTIGENFSESYFKHPWKARFPKRTHCKRGHEFSASNTGKYGQCVKCVQIRDRMAYEKRLTRCEGGGGEERGGQGSGPT